MKNLLIMRHGKAELGNGNKDRERSLMPRGQKQSREAALALEEQQILPGLIISSTANRAKETAQMVSEYLVKAVPIQLEDQIYLCSLEELIEVSKICPEEIETLLLVGHNPTMEFLLDRVSGSPYSVKTSEIYSFKVNCSRWQDIHVDALEFIGPIYVH
ncbi:MAG: histidine phosphatase family protein [Spirochaetaceae bacterium]|nr:histidine phosphatase family protein [Spirochaetaceae bacterium]